MTPVTLRIILTQNDAYFGEYRKFFHIFLDDVFRVYLKLILNDMWLRYGIDQDQPKKNERTFKVSN